MATSPPTTFSWREFVEKIDDQNRHVESLYPVVYEFSGGRTMRDSGPTKGPYQPQPW